MTISPLEKLQKLFTDLPGIGPRQARRFAYHILRKDENYIHDLITTINETRNNTRLCANSFQYFYTTDSNEQYSPISRDPNRDNKTLLIVEKDIDIENIERSKTYNGHYFVLGGTLPILAKQPERYIRINQLKKHIENKVLTSELQEIIVGMSFHPEGEYTAEYVRNQLADLADKHRISITTLGRGLSTGTELEYSDEDTIKNALENRK